jgi:molybdopterin converting factor small subunit
MSTLKAPSGHFTVLYFATAASYTGRQHDFFKAPVRFDKLFDALEERHAKIVERLLPSCAVTLNLDYIDIGDENGECSSDVEIQAGDEVAIIPPVSSG